MAVILLSDYRYLLLRKVVYRNHAIQKSAVGHNLGYIQDRPTVNSKKNEMRYMQGRPAYNHLCQT